MTVIAVLDSAGRRRSPATMPGYHAGRPPRNKGMLYPADPPRTCRSGGRSGRRAIRSRESPAADRVLHPAGGRGVEHHKPLGGSGWPFSCSQPVWAAHLARRQGSPFASHAKLASPPHRGRRRFPAVRSVERPAEPPKVCIPSASGRHALRIVAAARPRSEASWVPGRASVRLVDLPKADGPRNANLELPGVGRIPVTWDSDRSTTELIELISR
jgi:hypothetical protein